MVAMFNGQPIFGPRGPAGPDGNPIGTVISYMGTTAPEDYLVCDGAEYSIQQYPELAKFFETQFGTTNHFGGDGTTTFAVPDLRNMFLRGFHGDSEEQLSAEIGEKQNPTQHVSFYVMNNDGYMYVSRSSSPLSSTIFRDPDKIASYGDKGWTGYSPISQSNEYFSSGSLFTSRPINTAVLYCIKAATSVPAENVYSTEEQVIGRWIDGKPLYRQVFPFATTSSEWTSISVPENIDPVSASGYIVRNDDPLISKIQIPTGLNSSDYAIVQYGVGRLSVNLTSSFLKNSSGILVCEYTKTTD